MNRTRCLAALVLLAVLSAGVPAAAQTTDEGLPPGKHMITTNPFLLLFSWWNAEYEYRLNSTSTIGLAGSYNVFEDDESELDGEKAEYYSGYAVYRYHPSGKAHSGFYFGGRLGVTSIAVEYFDGSEEETGTAYGFGIELGYTWLLGDKQNFAISLGVGATRLFGSDLEDETGFLPIIRLANIGVAF